MSSAAPKPGKLEVALALLDTQSVLVHLDPRRPGVQVPSGFAGQSQLVLQLGRHMAIPVPDLVVDAQGIRATLSFQRLPFLCILPWTSIYALVGEDGRGGVWDEDVPPEVRQKTSVPAPPQGPPRELSEWCGEVSGRLSARRPLESRRAVMAVGGRRLVLDLRVTTFGAVVEATLGEDAAAPAGGPYRGGGARHGGPPFDMRRRTTLLRVLAFLRIVREITSDDAGFAARVSVRSDGPAAQVQASLAQHALRDAAIDLFDRRFSTVHVARPGSIVAARLPAVALADLAVLDLWHACHAMARIADALVQTVRA